MIALTEAEIRRIVYRVRSGAVQIPIRADAPNGWSEWIAVGDPDLLDLRVRVRIHDRLVVGIENNLAELVRRDDEDGRFLRKWTGAS